MGGCLFWIAATTVLDTKPTIRTLKPQVLLVRLLSVENAVVHRICF
jgi:hypothetical protein